MRTPAMMALVLLTACTTPSKKAVDKDVADVVDLTQPPGDLNGGEGGLEVRSADIPEYEVVDLTADAPVAPDTGPEMPDTVDASDTIDIVDIQEAELPPQCPDGDPCDDGNACTSDDTCNGGECLGIVVDCADDDPCTEDVCDPQSGCANPPACSENQVCTPEGNCCSPWECGMIGHECGTVSDECGATLDCGECAEGFECKEGVCSDGVCDVELVATFNGAAVNVDMLDEEHALLAVNHDGLYVLDVSSPAEPKKVGEFHYFDWRNLRLKGKHAFLQGKHNVTVLDLSEPSSPIKVGEYSLEDQSLRISDSFVVDSLLFLLVNKSTDEKYAGELRILDMTDPTSPQETLLGDLPEPLVGKPVYLHVEGVRAYVGMWGGWPKQDVAILNLDSPGGMTFEGMLAGEYQVLGVFGSAVYTSRIDFDIDKQILTVYDVAEPSTPVELGSYPGWGGHDLTVAGDLACVSSALANGGRLLDITVPTAPDSVGWKTTPRPRQCRISGDHVYVADHKMGLFIFDKGPGDWSTYLTHYVTAVYPLDVQFAAGVAYATSWLDGTTFVDVRYPDKPERRGYYQKTGDPPPDVWDVFALGNLLFLPYLDVEVLDVSDPGAPELLSSYPDGAVARVFAKDDTAWFSGKDPDLAAVDISDPTNPTTVATVDVILGGSDLACSDSTVVNGILYAACGSQLLTYSVADPGQPELLGVAQVWWPNNTPRLVRVGDGLAAVHDAYLHIFDVSDPSAPTQVALLNYCSEKAAFEFHGKYLFVADCEEPQPTYLKVYDMSDPAAPELEVAVEGLYGFTWNMHLAHGYAFVADQDEGLRIFDVRGCW